MVVVTSNLASNGAEQPVNSVETDENNGNASNTTTSNDSASKEAKQPINSAETIVPQRNVAGGTDENNGNSNTTTYVKQLS